VLTSKSYNKQKL